MSDHIESVDSFMRAVDRAEKRTKRRKSRQVHRDDERDFLRSIAYAWINTHRPALEARFPNAALASVDAEFRIVLDATSKYAARTTYVGALKRAKAQLAAARSASLLPPKADAAHASDVLPDFSPLASDPQMRTILQHRWEECLLCVSVGAYLAATVMMGGLLEALFMARANRMPDKGPLFKANSVPIDGKTKKPLQLKEWTLKPYIDVGAELGWITRSGKDVAAVLRDYRNYVHPEKQRSHGITPGAEDCRIFWALTKELAGQLLASVHR